jgi:hypothetical protein
VRIHEGHEAFDAGPCPECGIEAAEPEPGDKHQHHLTCRACGTTQTHLLKALPCANCPPRPGEPTTAFAGVGDERAIARLKDDTFYLMGATPHGVRWPWRYKCAACKKTTQITAAEFNRLRLMEPEEYLPLLKP